MAITCARCDSDRIACVEAKCSDLCNVWVLDKEHDGYVPHDLGIGGGDNVEFSYCMNCGQMMGTFPLPLAEIEGAAGPEDDDDDEGDDEKGAGHSLFPRPKPLDKDFLENLFK